MTLKNKKRGNQGQMLALWFQLYQPHHVPSRWPNSEIEVLGSCLIMMLVSDSRFIPKESVISLSLNSFIVESLVHIHDSSPKFFEVFYALIPYLINAISKFALLSASSDASELLIITHILVFLIFPACMLVCVVCVYLELPRKKEFSFVYVRKQIPHVFGVV